MPVLPKPASERRRRNAVPGTIYLPRGGRQGPPPEWPLTGKAPAVWAELWRTPQAAAWEKVGGHERTVARLARILVAAEKPGAVASLLSEVRQLEDRLGLNPRAMLSLRWEMADDDAGAESPAAAPASVRRLRAVDPDAVAGS